MKNVLLLIAVFSVTALFAQNPNTEKLVQLSGVVLAADSSSFLPLVSIGIKHSGKGTLTDETGYFSMVVKQTDTIVFSFIGFKTKEYVLPQSLSGFKVSIVQVLHEDTIYLNTAIIRSYPTPDEFNYYFVKASIPDVYYQSSAKNLRQKNLQQLALSMSMDASESGKMIFNQQAYQYYYNGQAPPNRVFDLAAWSQFYKSVKRGDYKKK